jgi:hypothetical protein
MVIRIPVSGAAGAANVTHGSRGARHAANGGIGRLGVPKTISVIAFTLRLP